MDFTFSILSAEGVLLAFTFFFSGIIDAVCGGGGLLSMPMYLTIGFPAHLVTGTNQCSIFFGGATSLVRYMRGGRIHWPSALTAAPLAIVGAFLGARLNLVLPERILEIVMIVLVPLVAAVILFKRDFGAENHINEISSGRMLAGALVIGLVIGAYQGFYGAGSGTFFMLGFCLLTRLDLTTASGNTKVVAFCANLSSAATFALSGAVVWPAVLLATVFNIAGSYIGAGLAMKRGAKIIRPMFLFVLALLFLRLAGTLF
ncbi:MAG: TSUP family transporter [Clostridia bacterium]|nr:TSUP family transporter [Clostridia bacterium]